MPTRKPNVSRIIELEMTAKGVKEEDLKPKNERDRLKEEPLDPNRFMKERPKSLRYFLLKTTGGFVCGKKHEDHKPPSSHLCSHARSSGQTWCIVDLKEKKILKPYTQRCDKLHVSNGSPEEASSDEGSADDLDEFEAIPLYGRKTVKKLAEWAVKQHLINAGKIEDDYVPPKRYRKTPAHRQALCKVCKILGRRCC